MADRSVATTKHVAFASQVFDENFKIFYDNTMGQLWTSWNPLLEWLEGEGRVQKKKPQGKYIQFPVETALTSGVGARGEGDTLPTARSMSMVQGKVDYQKGFKGRISLTEEAILWGKQGAGAFADVMEQEMKANENALRNLAGVAAWGNGDGMLAKTASVSTVTWTITSSEVYNTYNPGTRLLYEGMAVESVTASSNTYTDDVGPGVVSSITNDTTVVMTTDISSGMSAGYLTDPSSYTSATASSSRWPSGIKNIVDDGTFSENATLNVDPAFGCCGLITSSYPTWKAVKNHNSGTARALTTDLLYQLYYKVARKNGDMKQKVVCWTNPDVFRELVALLEPQVQYQARSLKPGFEEMDIMVQGTSIPIKLDFKAPSEIFFLNPKHLTFWNARPLGLVTVDGKSAVPSATTTAREYRYWWAWNMSTDKRNAHGLLTDLSFTITSV